MNVPPSTRTARPGARRRSSGRATEPSSRRYSWRAITFFVVLGLYLLLTLGVMFRSPVLTLDLDLFRLNLRDKYPNWNRPILDYVMFGQRGPATLVFLPYFFWVAWRSRSTRPLVMLVTSLIMLNLSVGVVKLATGRMGPRQTHNVHDILAGGDIYPSGHVSNAVVLYGLIALIATTHRRLAIAAAVFLSVTVGLGTVYLDTHWFSDVVGGWFAGALILLALPTVMPYAQRWADAAVDRLLRRLGRRPRQGLDGLHERPDRATEQPTGPRQHAASAAKSNGSAPVPRGRKHGPVPVAPPISGTPAVPSVGALRERRNALRNQKH